MISKILVAIPNFTDFLNGSVDYIMPSTAKALMWLFC